MTVASPLQFRHIQDAAKRIAGVAHRTPVLTSKTANALAGAELFFKCENFQRVGAFKFRGAYNALSQFTEAQRKAGVVSFSSGNHAQAIGLASRLLNIPALVLMPHDAPQTKITATREYGAEVQTYNRYTEDREAIGRDLAERRGMTLIPSYDHPDVICGQGTAALELFEEVGQLDVLLVCLGGGGLLAGSALAASGASPQCEVIGVEPALGNDGQQSFRAGKIIHIPVPDTIADGAKVTHVGEHNFPIFQQHVKDIVTVDDAQLISTMKFFAERMKIVVEPTGCLGAAAALQQAYPIAGKRVGVIVSGGNVDLPVLSQLLA
ncbi:threonine dehydratase [Herbaspirillum sp. Sphag1AN]|uniref:threo-3-hydroxy-L-aspartate ammonia-lyase n=1 Tax=unclassified Herbaspirillum TaxID=2624150 RepID=UPI001608213F|nr:MULTISPECIES: threo-3-hydroxy-L-aspartate ammonia-lyase [unclassified Herbaspirillum]MBB3212766.1 threonine dehydratase [Herbaspirillum sp. Sphag1AN]MBB3245963.1 threonine dehydratase [Herbaspirillum sp. Sphag64]